MRHGRLAATRHVSGIRGAGLDGFGTGNHVVAAQRGGIHVIGHAGHGDGLVAERAGRDGLGSGPRLGRRNAGDSLDLVAGGARREQRVAGADVNGGYSQDGCGDGGKEDSSFHVNFLLFGWGFIAPPNVV